MLDQNWPAQEIEWRKTADLRPYAHNARRHSDRQINEIAQSMREWGWTMPILVDETDMVLAGHGRLLAAQRLQWEQCPVVVARGWPQAKKQAYVLMDNKLAANSEWDDDKLKAELKSLRSLDFNMPLLGFSDVELDKLLAAEVIDTREPNNGPEVPIKGVVEPGDTWILAAHKLVVGADDVMTADSLVCWWQEHSGEPARLGKASGMTYQEVGAQRHGQRTSGRGKVKRRSS